MGGKSKSATVGYWYNVLYHGGLGIGPIDAFLEFRGGDKAAWKGELTSSGTIDINAPNLWGGEKDQGGIVGAMDVMFGEATQEPNAYLLANLGPQVPAWRGLATVVFKGGKYGAMNPYPQKASYKIRKVTKGWDNDDCWYPEKATITFGADRRGVSGETAWNVFGTGYFVIGAGPVPTGPYESQQGRWHGYVDSFRLRKGRWYTSEQYAIPEGPFADASSDPDTVLLLRFIGADGSTTFLDDKGHAITPHGGVALSTAQSKFGGSSAFFDGSDDWLSAAMGADENIGDTWTMDAWVWLESFKSDASTYGRALFGYSNPTVEGTTTAWYALGESWIFQRLDHFLGAPSVIQNVEPRAQLGRWAFVSICCDGASGQYFLHQDGKLLTGVGQGGMNPAHALYYARTHGDIGREPIVNMSDASYRAAADQLAAEGFAICTSYDPISESLEEFEQRICRVIGGSVSRSLVDGKWYLDLARGGYDLEDLPILSDDDILEFREQPSVLDGAINSVSIKYFDPSKKEEIVTSPIQALALIDSFGTVHQTNEYREIPVSEVAARVGERDLRACVTPTRAFEITTTRKTYAWRPNQYFRLQAPKRGIADMVCILGEKQSGGLRSGAIRIKAAQDIYALPETSFVEVEAGVDTRPPQTPSPIVHQRALEAPYIEVVRSLSRADLAALPPETGYLMALADDPAVSRDYAMWVSPDGVTYSDAGDGEWCPTALVLEGASYSETVFTLASGKRLDQVSVGSPALWDDEVVRVDAIDPVSGAITLGRGCADTIATPHAIGSRIWFYMDNVAADVAEYTAGETIHVKLLTSTGSQLLNETLASPIDVEFMQRQFRPYPPAKFRVNGEVSPPSASGEVIATWAHRDRVLQADQLVDAESADVGPEPGATYTARWFVNDALEHTDAGITGTSVAYTPAAAGMLRVEVETVRDGVPSLQYQFREFAIGSPLLMESDELITTEDDQPILME